MKRLITNTGMLLLWGLTMSLVSCEKNEEEPKDEVAQMIEEVRAITQSYTVHSNGVAAGWATDLSGCVAHPTEGGMGHHFGRLEYIDGRINHLEPQVLLYAPDANGTMELLGVEYLIPFAIHSEDKEPPTLFGQNYHKNQQIEMWALHLWSEKENPNGMFYDWNPDVSCQ